MKKKLLIIQLGKRIVISENNISRTGGLNDLLLMMKVINKFDDYNVEILTEVHKGENTNPYKDVYIKDIVTTLDNKEIDFYSYDTLLVFNGSINFFGGKEDKSKIYTYKVMNKFKGKILYLCVDMYTLLNQVWGNVASKKWNTYEKLDLNIVRNDIIPVLQGYDTKEATKFFNKVNVKEGIHYPLMKLYLHDDRKFEENTSKEFEYDLSYGGTFRNHRREEDLIKYYFGYPEDINVEIFGTIKLKKFNPKKITDLSLPDFNKPVKNLKFLDKMRNSMCTVIITDKRYKDVYFHTARIYEAIYIGNVLFIDKAVDPNYKIFSNETLKNFCYVSNRDDVIERIKWLKADHPARMNEIVELQKENSQIPFERLTSEFKEILDMEYITEPKLGKVLYSENDENLLYIIEDVNHFDYNDFDGFSFSNEKDREYYEANIISQVDINNTIHRGNLSKTCNRVLCGTKEKLNSEYFNKLDGLNYYPYVCEFISIEKTLNEILNVFNIINKNSKVTLLGNNEDNIKIKEELITYNITCEIL